MRVIVAVGRKKQDIEGKLIYCSNWDDRNCWKEREIQTRGVCVRASTDSEKGERKEEKN